MSKAKGKSRLVIAVDNGKMNVKAKAGITKTQEIIYPNRYSIGSTDKSNVNEKDSFNVTYNNEDFIMGSTGSISESLEGKATSFHCMSTLVAITRFIEVDEEREIYLMYGESIDMYFNGENTKTILRNLEGKHEIIVNDTTYRFTIAKVHVLPEGMGHILQDIENNMGMQYVVDIGGTTINWLEVLNGRPLDSSFSRPLGFHNLYAKIESNLKRVNYKLNRMIIDEYIKTRENQKDRIIKNAIDNAIINQLKEFNTELSNFNVDINNTLKHKQVFFVGGGSDELREEIEKNYKATNGNSAKVIEEGVLANVRGFYEYGVAMYGEEE